MGVSKVLIVDDEKRVLSALRRLMHKEAFEVVTTDSPEEVLRRLQEESYAVILADQRMPDMEGTRLLERAREVSPDTVRIILTGEVDVHAAVEAINRGAVYRFVAKPWNNQELRAIVRHGVAQHDLVVENRRLQAATERQNAELRDLNQALALAREQEVDIAAKIQQALLTGRRFRNGRGGQVAALTLPSEQIDGDFYDFFKYHDWCFDVVIGDAMGKGVPAALLGAATKGQILRAVSQLTSSLRGERFPRPDEIIASVHAEVTRQLIGLESFVTLCYARFDLARHRVDLVDCGHTKPIHFRRRTGACVTLQGINMPLGFSQQEVYELISTPVEEGDVFLFYSDGVTDVKNEMGERFGEGRLTALVRKNGELSPDALIDRIRSKVAEFSHSEHFSDDLTCVAVRVQAVARQGTLVGRRGRGGGGAALGPARFSQDSGWEADTVDTFRPQGADRAVKAVDVEVSSELTELARIRSMVRGVCRGAGESVLDEEDAHRFELAVHEAAANIAKHAYHGHADRQIQVRAEVFPDRICVQLYHLGEAFDPDTADLPAFDGSRESGFGLYIITQCVDEVTYSHCAERGKNCVRLVKKI